MKMSNQSPASRLLDVATLVMALIAVAVSVSFLWQRAGGPRRAPVREGALVPDWAAYATEGHRDGSSNAPITIIEFGDYECPACRSFYGTLLSAKKRFGDSLAVIYRHFPLEIHPLGQTAARAAECAADQGRFDAYHKLLYGNPSWLGIGARTLEVFAAKAGIPDSVTFANCLYAIEEVPAIQRDLAAGARLGVTETPTVLLNGRRITGLPDSAALVTLIERALQQY